MEKKRAGKKQGKESNKEYSLILWIFTGLFALMIGYLLRFQVVDSRKVIDNSYNDRIASFEKEVIRGQILAADGEVLAYTQVGEDGSEKRIYPLGCIFSHVLGYSEYGKTGIELMGNFQLLRSNAYFIERFLNELRGEKQMGDSLVTTLDVKLQTAAHDALGKNQGAVVVLEAGTGNVRALVSKPDYDPGEVADRWSEISTSEDSVLLNRALQGLYPPGSVYKTVTLLEYLRENGMSDSDFSYNCNGKIEVGDSSISCYHGNAHGELDLKRAFAKSCNSAFASIGADLEVSGFQTLNRQLLFNAELPLELPCSKSSFALKESDSEAIRMMSAIGQADTVVSPMHMALLMSAVVNDGVLMTPRFLDKTVNNGGAEVETYPLVTYGELMTTEEAGILRSYLRAVVEEGTASTLQSDSYVAAGKTGTAEYSNDKSRSHAWFAGYVRGEKPDLAVCVLVEAGGSGSETAVPIAKKIFEAYYGS